MILQQRAEVAMAPEQRRVPAIRMKRRAILVGLMAVLSGRHALGQVPERTYRLGHLAVNTQAERTFRDYAFPELANLGLVEGRHFVFDPRVGPAETLQPVARDLVAAKPDVIVAIGGNATGAARQATSSIPIVMFADDPVRLGWASSLSRPQGNVTGIANMVVELEVKRFQFLIEAVPATRRVAVLTHKAMISRREREDALRAAAKDSGAELQIYAVGGADDYARTFAAMRERGANALLISANPQFAADIRMLAALARDAHLPTSCEWAVNARSGCLLGYGPDPLALQRRMAHYVARIFRGVAPGELPIELPTRYEFVINLRTAKAVGIAVPPALVARADEIIE